MSQPIDYESFCVVPFLEANVMPNGSIRACCAFHPAISENKRPMSVYEHSVEDIWNSENMRDVRRRLIEGKRVPQCSYCYHQDKYTPPSLRVELNNGFAGGYGNPHNVTIQEIVDKAVANDYFVHEGPAWIDLELGNLCNLSCRMCSSAWSSKIASDPVHSKWSTKDIEAPLRWRGKVLTVAPRRGLGIEYSGFSALDQTGNVPRSWVDGAARVSMPSIASKAKRVRILLSDGTPSNAPFTVSINETVYSEACLEGGSATIEFDVSEAHLGAADDRISLDLTIQGKAAVVDISLLRESGGKNSFSLSRFEDGKQWFQDEEFLRNDLLYKVDNLTKLTMVGGEPFLIQEAMFMLQYLVDRHLAHNVTLSIVTNGTIANPEICAMLARFKSVLLGVSLDGTGVINDYIRNGSSWSTIDPNITAMKQIANAHVYVNMTVQAYNMMHIVPTLAYIESQGIGFRYHYLVGPPHLACGVMPVEARRVAAERLRAFVESLKGASAYPDNYARYQSLLANLEADVAPADPKLVDEFVLFTNDLDGSRRQRFSDINPELLEFFEAAGQAWSNATRFNTAVDAA